MSVNQAVKKNLSSMQVLKTLQILLENNYTMTELIEKLNEKEKRPVFNNSVVSKYINTCRYCGIEIPKIHNKYFVSSLPFGLNLTLRDLELFETLQKTAQEHMGIRFNREFKKFLEHISKYSNKHIIRVEEKTSDLTKAIFEKAVQEKRKIRLMFRAKSVLDCIPIAIVESRGKKYFSVFYKGKEKNISIDRISGIEVLGKRFDEEYTGQNIVFKITGELAKRYTLRENEQVIFENDEYKTISNRGEQKDVLFSRLLRYDSSCEVLMPQNYREDMAKLLKSMLRNYGV